jgi:hypothetical protein
MPVLSNNLVPGPGQHRQGYALLPMIESEVRRKYLAAKGKKMLFPVGNFN